MLISILLFVGGLSAGVILGGFGGYAASNGIARLKQTKARAELPDDELYREAYNEVADITGDIKVLKKTEQKPEKPALKFITGDVGVFYGQHWKIPGIKDVVTVLAVKDRIVTYQFKNNQTATVSYDTFKHSAKLLDE